MTNNNEFLALLGKPLDSVRNNPLIKNLFTNQLIEEIGDRKYLTNETQGIGLVFDDLERLISIQLHSSHDSYKNFSGPLPSQISFEDTMESVQKKVGSNNFTSGGGENLPILGWSNTWRRYEFPNSYLNIEFRESGQVRMITIGLIN
jgi:hypothetical protein